MVKFIHISDTHLGASDLELTNSEGINTREFDIYDAFRMAVDLIIVEKPDFVLHTGDIFHRSSPSNRALVEAAAGIQRIIDAGIKFYMIAGNHDYPKSASSFPIHDLFRIVNGCNIFFNEEYTTHKEEKFILHLLPHINSESKFAEETAKIEITDNSLPNILLMHLSVSSYLMDEYGERIFPEEHCDKLAAFNYVALGHWHHFNHLKKYGHVYYSGSIEAVSEREAGKQKGIVKVEIDNDSTGVTFIPLQNRMYRVIEINDVYSKTESAVLDEIKLAINEIDIAGGIFKVVLEGMSKSQFYEFPKNKIEVLFESALSCNITKTIRDEAGGVEYDAGSFDLRGYLSLDIQKCFTDEKEFNQMNALASRYLDEIEEEEARNAD